MCICIVDSLCGTLKLNQYYKSTIIQQELLREVFVEAKGMGRLQDYCWISSLGNHSLEKLQLIFKEQGLFLCEAFIDLPMFGDINGLTFNSILKAAPLIMIICLVCLCLLLDLSFLRLEIISYPFMSSVPLQCLPMYILNKCQKNV